MIRLTCLAVLLVFLVPVAISATIYAVRNRNVEWRTADRSSAGLLPPAGRSPQAVVRVFSARTVSWRGIVATHSWIVVKEQGAAAYARFDYTAWGTPIWVDRFVADGLWFGSQAGGRVRRRRPRCGGDDPAHSRHHCSLPLRQVRRLSGLARSELQTRSSPRS